MVAERGEPVHGHSGRAITVLRRDERGAVLRGLSLSGATVFFRVDAVADAVIRVRAAEVDYFEPSLPERDGFLRTEWPLRDFSLAEDAELLLFRTGQLTLQIDREEERSSFRQGADTILEAPGGGPEWRDDKVRLQWTSPADERFLGFADQGAGHSMAFPPDRAPLDHRGQYLQMAGLSSHRHYYVPFYLSSRAYGFFLNTLTMSWWDLARTDPGRVTIDVDERRLDYFVVGGPSMVDVLRRYTDLVGRPPLPPSGNWVAGRGQQHSDSRRIGPIPPRATFLPRKGGIRAGLIKKRSSGERRTFATATLPATISTSGVLGKPSGIRLSG